VEFRPTQIKQYSEKQITLRGGHMRGGKQRKEIKKVNMADVLIETH
jgi:hypothetical protein